jgi:hypothetical protein
MLITKIVVTGALEVVVRRLVRGLAADSDDETPHEVTVFDGRDGRIPEG